MKPLRSSLCALAILACACGVATPSLAQVNGVHFILEPWVGYFNFAKNVNLEDEPIYGGSLGLYLHRYVGIEAHLGRSSTETIHGFTPYSVTPPPTAIPQQVTMLHYGVDLVLNL